MHAYKGHPLSESKTALGEDSMCLVLGWNQTPKISTVDKFVEGLPEAHLNPTATSHRKGRKVTASEPDAYWELGSELLTPHQIAHH